MTSTTSAPTFCKRLRRALPLAAALLAFGATAASAAPANPSANIAPGPLPRACASAPRGAACIAGVVRALNHARAVLGFGPYLLPANFARLSGEQQLLVLSNLDRLAYKLPPINGLSPALNTVAADAVTADADPDPSALLGGFSTFGWASNWAGAYPNAPEAYYAWMYYDGWSGKRTSNLDCTGPTAKGCWGHREDVLAFPELGMLSMGASVSRDAHGQLGYAMTMVWTPVTNWTNYTYSWAQAQAAGAGSTRQSAVNPPVPAAQSN